MNYYNTLFKEIDNLESKYIDFWVDVCNTESPTNYKEGVDNVGKLFIDVAKKFGWDYSKRGLFALQKDHLDVEYDLFYAPLDKISAP